MNPMMQYAIVVLGVGVLCAAWTALQLWIRRRDPDLKNIFERGCGGSGDCGEEECGGSKCRSRG